MSLHIGTKTRDPLPGDIIVTEPEPNLSRQSFTIASSGTEREVKVGQVLGVITASGKVTEHDTGAATGEQVAAYVAIENVTVPAAGDTSIQVIRYHAVLRDQGLIFEGGISGANRTAALAALAAKFIFTA